MSVNCLESMVTETKRKLFTGRLVAVYATLQYGLLNILLKISTNFTDPTEITAMVGQVLLLLGCVLYFTMDDTQQRDALNKIDIFTLTIPGILLLSILILENLSLTKCNAGDTFAAQYGGEIVLSALISVMYLSRGRFAIIRGFLAFASVLGIFSVFQQDMSVSVEDIFLDYDKTLGIIMAIGSGVLYAFFYTIVKVLTERSISLSVIIIFQSVSLILGSICIKLIYFHGVNLPKSISEWTVYICVGLLESLGLVTSLRALITEEVLSVSVILTFEVSLTYIFELLVLQTVPTLSSVIGAVVITLSCIVMVTLDNDNMERTPNEFSYIWLPPFSMLYSVEQVYVTKSFYSDKSNDIVVSTLDRT